MSVAVIVLAAIGLVAWLYLLIFHGRFWLADQRLPAAQPDPPSWPAVTAVVPARDEADVIGEAVTSLLTQDYPGSFRLILVDDGSQDGTADAARRAAEATGAADRFEVISAPPLPEGWTGKMWAVSQGVAAAGAAPDYLLLTDADIAHAPGIVRRLAARAEADARLLVSLMVRLHCAGWAERLLIPAFVFFFQKLYPFPTVNNPARAMAGAAGGCMLVRRTALEAAGGIEAIGDALIDDCALARRIKPQGPIWLGLAEGSRSIRPYDGLGGIWRMVARTAYTQLGHSPLLLAGTVLGMALLYLAPPIIAVWALTSGNWPAGTMAAGATALMLMAYLPTCRLYRSVWPSLPLLPLAGLLYTAMTVDSARRHAQGRGGGWKGRAYRSASAYGRGTPPSRES